jgi:hypothetical protein
MLVPDPLSKIDTPWGPSLIMPDLGIDFRQASVTPESTRKNFRILQNSLTRVFRSSLRNGQELHAKGIEETIRQAAKWLSELEKVKLISLGSLEKLHRLDSTALSGSRAAIMLLDFTPDNVFIIGNSAKFIDPWKQREYIGAPIPGISQFITLSEDVYHIPGFNDNDLQYSSFIDEIGLSLLGLTPTQLSGQVNLGRVLQYSLSSFVRIKSNPDLSRFYADLAEKALSNIT